MKSTIPRTLALTFLLWGIALVQQSFAQMLDPGYGTMGAPMSNYINDNYLLNDQLDKGESNYDSSDSDADFNNAHSSNESDEATSIEEDSSAANEDDPLSTLTKLFNSVPPEQRPAIANQLRSSMMSSPQFQQASAAEKEHMLEYLSSLIEQSAKK